MGLQRDRAGAPRPIGREGAKCKKTPSGQRARQACRQARARAGACGQALAASRALCALRQDAGLTTSLQYIGPDRRIAGSPNSWHGYTLIYFLFGATTHRPPLALPYREEARKEAFRLDRMRPSASLRSMPSASFLFYPGRTFNWLLLEARFLASGSLRPRVGPCFCSLWRATIRPHGE